MEEYVICLVAIYETVIPLSLLENIGSEDLFCEAGYVFKNFHLFYSLEINIQ